MTPYIAQVTRHFVGQKLSYLAQEQIRKRFAEFIQKHFSKYVSESLAHLFIILIKENWDRIKGTTSAKHIAQFLLNKIIRGSGNLLLE